MKDEKLESKNQSQYGFKHPSNLRLGGLVIIIAGVLLLLARIPQTANYFPRWLFTWQMLLIALGVFVGALHGFRRSFGWLVLILIGLGFLLYQQHIITAPLSLYVLPAALIVGGLFVVFKKHNHSYYGRWQRKQERWQRFSEERKSHFTQFSVENSDIVRIRTIFGSVEKRFISKSFQGGDISCSFGSCELDLTQVDFEQTAMLNISVNFGVVEIMLPANWAIQNELDAFAGNVADERLKTSATPEKTLILKGNVSFGDVEIRN